MFNGEENVPYVCSECESEYEIKTLYSDLRVKACPFCTAPIEIEKDED